MTARWSLQEHDSRRIDEVLSPFLAGSGARCALLIDRAGQLIHWAGEHPGVDSAALASLAAADFSANEQLATLVGGAELASLVHQGGPRSLLLGDVAGRLILVVVFDAAATLGMVRHRARAATAHLGEVFEEVFQRAQEPAGIGLEAAWASEAQDELERLFGGR